MMKNKSQKNISDGWQEIRVDDVFNFLRTYAISRENLINNTNNNVGIGNIHYGDIYSTYNSSNIDLRNVSVPLVKDNEFSPNEEDFLNDGDLIMADVSEDYEGIGVTVSIHGIEDKKVVGGLHTFVLRDVNKKTNERYRQYIFRNPEIRNKLKKIANGVSVYGISKNNLAKLLINLPPLPEQGRIVAVLEVWDEMVGKMARKIEIKKNIKKGLMQELLSGKKRLRGFSEKWTSLEFSDCFYVQSKIKGEKKQDYLKEGLFPVVDQSQNKIAGYSNNQDFVIKNSLPFIIFGDHTRILKLIDFPFILGNDGTKVFQGKEKYDTTFLFYLLDTISVPNTGYNRHFKFLKDLILEIPKLKEQKAIADILVMADREIEKLEEKLKIIKEQKKFLLNNLITGNIRTPVDKK
ncbi:MAG TPA: hypothetical protein DEA46_02985 [Candidatus Moranbacteria bacterium]|nr:hypothetical protein [Candidatus Moranbacteria bacterium]